MPLVLIELNHNYKVEGTKPIETIFMKHTNGDYILTICQPSCGLPQDQRTPS